MTKNRWKRRLRGFGIALGGLIVLVYLGLPAGMGVAAVFPSRDDIGPAPEGFSEISLTAQDGAALQAWYRPPEHGVAILLLHGAGGSRESVRPYAQMLSRHGFGVLALDQRGHGTSAGKTNRLGWQGTLDVGAALDFLQQQAEVKQIGGLGISMGGEVLLGAASTYPQMRAIAADGATRRCTEELLALSSERPLARNFTARVMYSTVQVLSGQQPPEPLLQSMVNAGQTRFLLIAGGNNALEVSFNQMFQKNLGERAALWVAPGAGHTEGYLLFPQEYEQLVIPFFTRALEQ